MDTSLLRAFTLVAAHLNFTRAADELHLSQSSLSRQILHLERLVGGRVFDRGPRHVRLTELGEQLLPRAGDILADVEELLDVAERFRNGTPTRLVLGVAADAHDRLAVTLLAGLRRRFPEAQFVIRHVDLGGQAEALEARSVDVLIARPPLETDGVDVTCHPLGDEPLVLVLPPHHHLAGRSEVTEAEVRALNIPTPAWLPQSWRREYPVLDGDGADQPAALVAGDFRDVVSAVAVDGTPGVVPESFADSAEAVAVLRISDAPTLSLQLAHLVDRADEPAVAALVEVGAQAARDATTRVLDVGSTLRSRSNGDGVVFSPVRQLAADPAGSPRQ